MQTFTRSQFDLVAKKWRFPTPWPEQTLFEGVISRANGLFIFTKTLVLALRECEDPDESLKAALQDSGGTGLKPLYSLYSSILRERRVPSNAEFRQMIGVLLTTAQYRPLCEETIAELAGVRPNLVKKWVNDLSSLLYQDNHWSLRLAGRGPGESRTMGWPDLAPPKIFLGIHEGVGAEDWQGYRSGGGLDAFRGSAVK